MGNVFQKYPSYTFITLLQTKPIRDRCWEMLLKPQARASTTANACEHEYCCLLKQVRCSQSCLLSLPNSPYWNKLPGYGPAASQGTALGSCGRAGCCIAAKGSLENLIKLGRRFWGGWRTVRNFLCFPSFQPPQLLFPSPPHPLIFLGMQHSIRWETQTNCRAEAPKGSGFNYGILSPLHYRVVATKTTA